MKKLLIAGCGRIGKKHIEGFLKTGKFKISVCDIDGKKLKEAKKSFKIEGTYTDFFKIIIEKFDCVPISTPTNYHIKMALRCAEKKVPFLVEKPFYGYEIYDNLDFGGKVETEDSAAIVSKSNNTIVNFYCNLFQKPYEVFIEFAGTKGNLRYISEDKYLSEIFFCDSDNGKWKKLQEFENEVKDYYFYQEENFLNLLEGRKNTLTTLKESVENLKFCLKIKRR